jgi:hypothetical protein
MSDLAIIETLMNIGQLGMVLQSGRLMIQYDDQLLAFHEQDLSLVVSIPVAVDFRSSIRYEKLFSDLKLSDTWTANPRSGILTLVEQKKIRLIPDENPYGKPRWAQEDLPQNICEAWGNDDASFILGQMSRDDIHPDFEYFEIFSIDLRSSRVFSPHSFRSTESMKAVWNPKIQSFLIHEEDRQQIWSWSPSNPAPQLIDKVDEESPATERLSLDFLGRFVVKLMENENGQSLVFRGVPRGEILSWGPPMVLPEGSYEDLTWHPEQDVFVCHRTFQDEENLCMLENTGKILREVNVPPSCFGVGLTWSGNGGCVYSAGDQTLCIWKPFAR